jgi:polysaccharide export outer membrane protein
MFPSTHLNTHTMIGSRHAERSEASLRPFSAFCALTLALIFALPGAALAQAQATPPKPPQTMQSAPTAPLTPQSPTAMEGRLDYSIGPQDLLGVTFLEAAELSRDVRVGLDGTVSLPFLAERVRVSGLTLGQAEELLKRKYQEAGILNQPNISVAFKELVSKPVTVTGAVRNPGVFQLGTTLPLMRVITQAGGFTEETGTVVQVVRSGTSRQDEVIRVKIEDLRMGLLEANIPVYGGDTVNVLPAGAVYVVGAVNRPGRHSLRSDSDQMTVLRMVALAEDTKKTARLDSTVILRKDASGKTQEIPVNLRKILQRKAPDVAVMANDVIFIPDSLSKRALGRFGESAIQASTTLLLLGLL